MFENRTGVACISPTPSPPAESCIKTPDPIHTSSVAHRFRTYHQEQEEEVKRQLLTYELQKLRQQRAAFDEGVIFMPCVDNCVFCDKRDSNASANSMWQTSEMFLCILSMHWCVLICVLMSFLRRVFFKITFKNTFNL